MPVNANPPRGRLRPLLSGVVLRAQSDARLSLLARDGSKAAFDAIYERYSGELRAHAARVVRADRAEDVVQHAMLMAWGTLLDGNEPIVDLRAWLHRVVHNAAINMAARRGYGDSELPATAQARTLTDETAENRLTAAGALAAIAALPEAQRRALTMTAIHGLSGRDAAQRLGVSETAVRQLVRRARGEVRAAVSVLTPWPVILQAARWAGEHQTAVAASGIGASGTALGVKVAAVAVLAASSVGTAGALHHRASPPTPRAVLNKAPPVQTAKLPQARPAARSSAAPNTVSLAHPADRRSRERRAPSRAGSLPTVGRAGRRRADGATQQRGPDRPSAGDGGDRATNGDEGAPREVDPPDRPKAAPRPEPPPAGDAARTSETSDQAPDTSASDLDLGD